VKLARATARHVSRAAPTGDRSEPATVAVVNGDGTVDVTTVTGTVPKVRRFTHYPSPAVGDKVIIVRTPAGDRYVQGKLA